MHIDAVKVIASILVLLMCLVYSTTIKAADTNIRYKDMPVSPPSVPSMGSSGAYSDICVVARAGGVSGGFIGFSAGIQVVDKNCQMIKLSRALAQLGMKVSATAMLCRDPRVFESMIAAGSPCPVNGLIGDKAIAEYRKRGILDEQNNVIKNPSRKLVKFDVDKSESVSSGNYGQPTN
jgi:hypothetical protein